MRKIVAIILVCILCIGLAACHGGSVVRNDGYMNEWISPDGVHYWKDSSGYAGWMAPRYDNDGNLVIDD